MRADIKLTYKGENPCRNCAERCVGCHGSCAKYAEWNAKSRGISQSIHEKVSKELDFRQYKIDNVTRTIARCER